MLSGPKPLKVGFAEHISKATAVLLLKAHSSMNLSTMTAAV